MTIRLSSNNLSILYKSIYVGGGGFIYQLQSDLHSCQATENVWTVSLLLSPRIAPLWLMLLCTGTTPPLHHSLQCKMQRNVRLPISNCPKCKVHKLRVTTSTFASPPLSFLNFTKHEEGPTSSDTLRLLLLNSHCPETPSVCMGHLSLCCSSGRSQPTASTFGMGVATVTGCVPHLSLLVEDHARETPLHLCVDSSHFPCGARSIASGWNSPERLCSLSCICL